MFDSIGFIGAGRVAQIMLGGWQRTSTVLPDTGVFDVLPGAVAALQAEFPAVKSESLAQVAGRELIFVALPPPAVSDVLALILPHLSETAVVVSLAPKIRLPALQTLLGGRSLVARMNPNAPSIVGTGFNPVVFAEGFPLAAREALLDLMAPLGASPQVADPLIEACAVITAMGPTYFWFQFDALRQLAEAFGMEPSFARNALRSMLHGAVDTLFDSDLPAQRVMDLVAVRPLADDEAQILGHLRERVAGIHLKLTS